MAEPAKLLLDIVFAVGILYLAVGTKFNQWTNEKNRIFSGNPRDYINELNFYTYWLIYMFTLVFFITCLKNFPELVSLVPGQSGGSPEHEWSRFMGELLGQNSYTVYTLLVLALLSNRKISRLEERWREYLHNLARIPRAVEELRKNVHVGDATFIPSSRVIKQSIALVVEDISAVDQKEAALEYWTTAAKNKLDGEHNSALVARFLDCLSLWLIVKENCDVMGGQGCEDKFPRIQELASIIPSTNDNEDRARNYVAELKGYNELFVELLCKQIVRKYPRKTAQYHALSNLGFKMPYHDTEEADDTFEAIATCLLGIVVITAIAILVLQLIRAGYAVIRDGNEFSAYLIMQKITATEYTRWVLGGILCYTITILVSVASYKSSSRGSAQPGLLIYFIAFFFSLLGGLTWFEIAEVLQEREMPIMGKLALVISFSAISPFVIRALSNLHQSHREVTISALRHAIALGTILAMTQVTIFLAFGLSYSSEENPFVVSDNLQQITLYALVGLIRGMCLGGLISYTIQNHYRRHSVTAQRRSPRAKFRRRMSIVRNKTETVVSIINISRGGAMAIGSPGVNPGDQISLKYSGSDSVAGVVKWVKSRSWGKKMFGITFDSEDSKINRFMREGFGEYYA